MVVILNETKQSNHLTSRVIGNYSHNIPQNTKTINSKKIAGMWTPLLTKFLWLVEKILSQQHNSSFNRLLAEVVMGMTASSGQTLEWCFGLCYKATLRVTIQSESILIQLPSLLPSIMWQHLYILIGFVYVGLWSPVHVHTVCIWCRETSMRSSSSGASCVICF